MTHARYFALEADLFEKYFLNLGKTISDESWRELFAGSGFNEDYYLDEDEIPLVNNERQLENSGALEVFYDLLDVKCNGKSWSASNPKSIQNLFTAVKYYGEKYPPFEKSSSPAIPGSIENNNPQESLNDLRLNWEQLCNTIVSEETLPWWLQQKAEDEGSYICLTSPEALKELKLCLRKSGLSEIMVNIIKAGDWPSWPEETNDFENLVEFIDKLPEDKEYWVISTAGVS